MSVGDPSAPPYAHEVDVVLPSRHRLQHDCQAQGEAKILVPEHDALGGDIADQDAGQGERGGARLQEPMVAEGEWGAGADGEDAEGVDGQEGRAEEQAVQVPQLVAEGGVGVDGVGFVVARSEGGGGCHGRRGWVEGGLVATIRLAQDLTTLQARKASCTHECQRDER